MGPSILYTATVTAIEIGKAAQAHPFLSTILIFVQNGWPKTPTPELGQMSKGVWRSLHELAVYSGDLR